MQPASTKRGHIEHPLNRRSSAGSIYQSQILPKPVPFVRSPIFLSGFSLPSNYLSVSQFSIINCQAIIPNILFRSMNSPDDNANPGGALPSTASVSSLGPVKMVQIAQFLPKDERDALFVSVCANQASFQRPGIPRSDAGGSLYLSLDSDECDRSGVGPVREATEFLSKRILGLLPTLFTALNIDPFAVSKIPLTLVNGLDGHNGIPHADSIDGRFKISLLYYFHRVPKAFRGGDLEFYDTDAASPKGHSDETSARIDHQDNLLIAFSSQSFHGVTEVQCDSDDFADGRFAAIGFLGPQ